MHTQRELPLKTLKHSQSSSCNMRFEFSTGDQVEVIKHDRSDSDTKSYYHVTLLRPPAMQKNLVFVEYKTLTILQSDGSKPKTDYVELNRIRPLQPVELNRCFKVGDEVDALRQTEGCWIQGVVKGILDSARFLVRLYDDLVEIEAYQWDLRLHREWNGDDESWSPPPLEINDTMFGRSPTYSEDRGTISNNFEPQMLMSVDTSSNPKDQFHNVNNNPPKLKLKIKCREPAAKFQTGTSVEVSSDVEGCRGSWYPAMIVDDSKGENKFIVEYLALKTDDGTKPLRKEIEEKFIRPCPPHPPSIVQFKVLEEVDAWYKEGWSVGIVLKALHGFKYIVFFRTTNEEIMFRHSDLRIHHDWIDGKWLTSQKDKSTDIYGRARKMRKIEGSKSLVNFDVGTKVEVSSEEEGYKGSYYAAVVVGFKEYDKFVVEYLTLMTDGETGPLREEREGKYIRPYPPQLPSVVKFQVFQKVDVWQNEGWWVGVVSRVLNDKKYIVYFESTNEELEYAHSDLRTHQDWIDGKWVKSPKEKVKTQVIRPNMPTPKNDVHGGRSSIYSAKGMHVEVKSDEEGYEGAWFAATIVNLIGHGKYLVEYQTLKTEDECHSLKEEVHVSNIRPCPPPIRRVCRYDLLEFVDAWYNDGWWVGQVYKLHAGSRYGVHFKSTNEILEFDHWDLRPHQEWRDGVWAFSADRVGIDLGVQEAGIR